MEKLKRCGGRELDWPLGRKCGRKVAEESVKLNGRTRHGTSARRTCGKKASGVPWTQVVPQRVHEGGGFSFVVVELIGHLLLAGSFEEVNV